MYAQQNSDQIIFNLMSNSTSGIFYTTRAITGREGDNLCRHITVLNHEHSTVDMLTGLSENGKKHTADYADVSYYRNYYGAFYHTQARDMQDWMAVYSAINPVLLANYTALYIIGGLDLHRSNLGRFQSRRGIFPHDRAQLKFQSCGIHLVNILAMLKAHNEYGIPLHELAFDPNEMSCDLFHSSVAARNDGNHNYHLYHGYDIPLYGAKRLDSLQYWLLNQQQSSLWATADKSIDFTFGYTVLKNSGRQHYVDAVNTLGAEFATSKIFVKNEYTKENTHVNGDVYLDYIQSSRYTYMLPSYNTHCFSIYRFLESIFHDCLPLIHSDCNIQDVGRSYDVLEVLSELQSGRIPCEKHRQELLTNLKEKMLCFDKNFIV